MESDRHRLTSELRANLVAYLDGELARDEAEAFALRIDGNSTARRDVELLRGSWRLLDTLVMPSASPELTSRLLLLADADGTSSRRFGRGSFGNLHQVAMLLVIAAFLGVAFLAGMGTSRIVWGDQTNRLASELAIAENVEAYRAVGSYEFLQQLDESPEIHRLATKSRGATRAPE